MVNWLKRRVLPLILAVAMLASYLPVSAFAEGDDNTKYLDVLAGQSMGYYDAGKALGVEPSVSIGNGSTTYRIFDSDGKKVFPVTDIPDSGWIWDLAALLDSDKNTWSEIASGTYTVQKGNISGSVKYSINWDEAIPFQVRYYSNLQVSTNLQEGTDGIKINGETTTSANLYEGEPATIVIPDVAGYTYTVDGATPVEGEENTYTVAYQNQPQTNVTVTYSPEQAVTVQVAAEDATVQVNGSDYTDGMQVAANSDVTLTIKPAANKYVSAVTVNGKDKAVSFDSKTGTYTTDTFQASAGGETDMVEVTCGTIIPTNDISLS